ncbi:MAG: hypothetical protein RLZZ305_1607 [Actinomycetota bacterium]
MSTTSRPRLPAAHRPTGHASALASLWTLALVPVGVVFAAAWSIYVDTSPVLSDEERIRGWGTVVRELPGTLSLLAVVGAGLALAVRAGRLGDKRRAALAIGLHGAALFVVLLIVMNGSAENIMTTRPSTVKWLLLPVQVAAAGAAVWAARRSAGVSAQSQPR